MTDLAPPRSRDTRRGIILIMGLVVLVIAAALWSLGVGAVAIPLDVIVNTVFDLDGEKQTYIIMRSRLPRMVLALLSGENVQSPDHLPAVLVPRETTSRARNS